MLLGTGIDIIDIERVERLYVYMEINSQIKYYTKLKLRKWN
ncbi:MAG: hypothetical protein RL208_225 [Pseudomonadota bacterium]|jgi:phosphopantetheinyl transferase (holo-ACP synthase)